MRATPETRRAIIHAWLAGTATQQQLADLYALSRTYVNKVIVDGVPPDVRRAVVAAGRPKRPATTILAALTDDDIAHLNRSHSSLAAIGATLGIPDLSLDDEYAAWGGRRFQPCAPVARSTRVGDPGLWRAVDAVRRVVEAADGPVTPSVYRQHIHVAKVSISTVNKVVRRLGWEWGDIVVAAGGERPPRFVSGRPRIFEVGDVIDAVNDYLQWEQGRRPTIDGYGRWRVGRDVPSYSTLLAVLGVRSWREVIDRCSSESAAADSVHA